MSGEEAEIHFVQNLFELETKIHGQPLLTPGLLIVLEDVVAKHVQGSLAHRRGSAQDPLVFIAEGVRTHAVVDIAQLKPYDVCDHAAHP